MLVSDSLNAESRRVDTQPQHRNIAQTRVDAALGERCFESGQTNGIGRPRCSGFGSRTTRLFRRGNRRRRFLGSEDA